MLTLRDFDITEEFGFILPNPLEKLPDYFAEWNKLAAEAPELALKKELRAKVEALPLLDHRILTSHEEKRLAHLQLCSLTTCYVWQEGDQGVSRTLPRCLAIPFCAVSDDLGVPPIIGHVSIVLANWKLKHKNRQLGLPNLQSIYPTVPGGSEADWFLMVTAQIELDFAPAVKGIIHAINAADDDDRLMFISSCSDISQALEAMKQTLSKMHDHLTPDTFYNVMRPFLAGYGGKNSPLPDGLIYEGVSDTPQTMIGGSAAQSSTMQCFDVSFGVEHEHDIKTFLQKMRLHMPTKHRQFIEEIQLISGIRTYASESRDRDARQAYNGCIKAAADFRSYHIQIITKYIVIMSRQKNRNRDYDSVAEQGTGGSSLTPFLKSIRDHTLAMMLT